MWTRSLSVLHWISWRVWHLWSFLWTRSRWTSSRTSTGILRRWWSVPYRVHGLPLHQQPASTTVDGVVALAWCPAGLGCDPSLWSTHAVHALWDCSWLSRARMWGFSLWADITVLDRSHGGLSKTWSRTMTFINHLVHVLMLLLLLLHICIVGLYIHIYIYICMYVCMCVYI